MSGIPIQLCNYKFRIDWRTPKGQPRHEIKSCTLSPLIGADEQSIKDDPTGYNRNTMRRVYMRTDGTKTHIHGCTFKILEIEIIKQQGSTMWKDKKV